jgi:hypothetical protein
MNVAAFAADKPLLPTAHTTRNLEGWTVRVDDRLLFASNDFYPFVTGELKQAEPQTFALLADIWGPLPGIAPPDLEAKK